MTDTFIDYKIPLYSILLKGRNSGMVYLFMSLNDFPVMTFRLFKWLAYVLMTLPLLAHLASSLTFAV